MDFTDLKRSALELYEGGWRAADRSELVKLYELTDEQAETICGTLRNMHLNEVYDFASSNWEWAQDEELDTDYNEESAEIDLYEFSLQDCDGMPYGITPKEYSDAVNRVICEMKAKRFDEIRERKQCNEKTPQKPFTLPHGYTFTIDYSDRNGKYCRTQRGIVFAETEEEAQNKVWNCYGNIYAYNVVLYDIENFDGVIPT